MNIIHCMNIDQSMIKKRFQNDFEFEKRFL